MNQDAHDLHERIEETKSTIVTIQDRIKILREIESEVFGKMVTQIDIAPKTRILADLAVVIAGQRSYLEELQSSVEPEPLRAFRSLLKGR
jgi:hypothetical protein